MQLNNLHSALWLCIIYHKRPNKGAIKETECTVSDIAIVLKLLVSYRLLRCY